MAATGEAVQVHDGEEDEIHSFLRLDPRRRRGSRRDLLLKYEAEVRLVVRRQIPAAPVVWPDSLDFLQSVWGSFSTGSGRRRRSSTTVTTSVFPARAAKNKVIDEYRRAGS